MFLITRRKQFGPTTFLWDVKAPDVARAARPGHFIMARIDEHGERIPLTVADFNVDHGTVTVVIQAVGKTTFEMMTLREGDTLLDFIGPLGLPSDIRKLEGTVVLVGGGLGVAPIYPQLREYKLRGNRTISIVGFRNRDLMFWEDEFRAYSDQLIVTTDDGSYGRKGFVSQALADVLATEKDVREVVAIGPLPMMKACCETTRPFGVPTVVSLNSIMVDGTGMCGSCRVTVGGKMKFACVDGADFDGHLVNFDELSLRQKRFQREEKAAMDRYRDESTKLASFKAAEAATARSRAPPANFPSRCARRARPAPSQEHQEHPARARAHAAPAGRRARATISRKWPSASISKPRCTRPTAACAARSRAACPAARSASTSPASSPPFRKRDFKRSYQILKSTNALPAVCGRVCPQETQCECTCPKSPRDAIGATVYLTAGGIRQRGDVMSGGSFESSNDQRLHFGIGDNTTITKIEIRWPSGALEQVSLPSIDRIFLVEEGKGVVPSVYDQIAQSAADQKRAAHGAN